MAIKFDAGNRGNLQYADSIGSYTDGKTEGAIPVLWTKALAAGAIGNTDTVLEYGLVICDAFVVLTGAGVASCTLTVGTTTAACTSAMAVSGSDKAVVRSTTLDDAQRTIAAGGTIRITTAAGATQPNCIVYVLGYRP